MQIAGDMSGSKKEFPNNTKDREECMINSSQVKRRRMLQFESEFVPVPFCNEDMLPTFLDEKVCIFLYISCVCRYLYNHISGSST